MNVQKVAEQAKKAARVIAVTSTEKKNAVLRYMIGLLESNKKKLVQANKKDLAIGEERELPENILRRLVFHEAKVESRIHSLKKIIELNDPVGQIGNLEKRPNGLLVGRMRVPLGVILIKYVHSRTIIPRCRVSRNSLIKNLQYDRHSIPICP